MTSVAAPAGARRRRMLAGAGLRAGLVLVLVIAVDQLTKRLVEHSIVPGEQHAFMPGIELVDTRNRGIAFGLEPGSHILITLIIGLALLALLVYFARSVATRPLIWLPTGMLLGGALGNLIDRVRSGSVVDFVKLPLGWPPFNLADVSIVLGVFILLFVIESPRSDASELPERADAGR
jgi:signal peptidase II